MRAADRPELLYKSLMHSLGWCEMCQKTDNSMSLHDFTKICYHFWLITHICSNLDDNQLILAYNFAPPYSSEVGAVVFKVFKGSSDVSKTGWISKVKNKFVNTQSTTWQKRREIVYIAFNLSMYAEGGWYKKICSLFLISIQAYSIFDSLRFPKTYISSLTVSRKCFLKCYHFLFGFTKGF